MKNFLLSLGWVLLVIILSFGTIRPLFSADFFPMHDNTQPARIDQMAKSLSAGQFPVRWVGELGYGYGYPLFNFYAPLPYYIGAIFNLMGFDAISSTKIMFMLGIVLAGLTMFFLVKEIGGRWAALTSAILYMYAPYHAVDIYVRGAVGEFYALGFLPLILLGIIKITKPFYSSSPSTIARGKLESRSLIRDSSRQARTIKQGVLIGAVGLVGTFLSHNIMGMITGYFLIFGLILFPLLFLLPSPRGSPFGHPRGSFKALLFTILLGFGLSAFFTFPAVVEKNYTKVEELTSAGSNFRNHFVYLDQLWNSPWGYAGSAPGKEDGMSFKIGKIQLMLGLVGVAAVIYLFKKKRVNTFHFSLFTFHFSLFLISVFLMLESSKFIWETLPGFSYIQYPWRFLSFTIFALSFIVSAIFIPFKKLTRIILSVLIIGITIWLNVKYFTPQEFLTLKPQDYISSQNLRYKISKISDEYLPKEFIIPQNINQVAYSGIAENPDITVLSKSESPTEKKYYLTIVNKTNLLTNVAFFPGWQAVVDNAAVAIKNNSGRIEVELPSGKHLLSLKLFDTPIRTLANTISIFSFFLLLYVLLFWKGNFPWQKNFQLK